MKNEARKQNNWALVSFIFVFLSIIFPLFLSRSFTSVTGMEMIVIAFICLAISFITGLIGLILRKRYNFLN